MTDHQEKSTSEHKDVAHQNNNEHHHLHHQRHHQLHTHHKENKVADSINNESNNTNIEEVFDSIKKTVLEQINPSENGKTPLSKNIEKGRMKINENLEKFEKELPALADTVNPSRHSHVIHDSLLKSSEYLHENYPYATMLARTQGKYVSIGVTCLAILGTKRFGKKVALFSGVSVLTACWAGIKIANYKWVHGKL